MVEISSANQVNNIKESSEECSTLDASMKLVGDVSDQGVTVFDSEACEAVDALGNYMPMALAMPQPDIQDLKAYFGRPRLVQRGTIPFGSTAFLYAVGFERDNNLLRQYFPQWTQRLAGAYGIRFTLNFRLQVAATAFHQGVLAMSFQYGQYQNAAFNRLTKPFTCTNVPHVRLDISEQTMAELRVPFLAATEFIEVEPQTLNNPTNVTYGGISITPILPSVTITGLAVPTWDLYCYLTDIELFGADVINPSVVVLQGGSDLISKEVKDSKVVSKTLSNMAKISSFVSRGIPSLAAIAGPAAWALDTAAGVAKYFGYAKPMIQDPATKAYRTNYGNEYNVDMPQVGDVVGPFQGNTTVIDTSLGASDVDEMAIAFVASQWSQVCRTQVATTNSHGLAIYSAPVSPSVLWFRTGTTVPFSNLAYPTSSTSLTAQTGNCFMPSSLMYISSFFKYWRGSMKFRFTFAKTKLHGGRYMVTFNPLAYTQFERGNFGSNVTGPEIVDGFQQPYGNSMIMDLKDSNVFEFTVPYVSNLPYVSFNSSIGGLTMVCIDPLQATGTVANTVAMLVEVCAGEDWELADYSGVYFPLQVDGTVYTQGGGELVSKTIKPPHDNTMGDRIMSAKQIIQMPAPFDFNIGAGTTDHGFIAPWFCNPTHLRVNALAALPNAPVSSRDFNGGNSAAMALARCYAFAKGGTDVHVYHSGPNILTSITQASSQVGNAFQSPATLSRQAFPSSVPSVLQSTSLVTHARLPSYQPLVRIPTNSLDLIVSNVLNPSLSGTNGVLGQFYRLVTVTAEASTTNSLLLRSASDDAQLAMYMGPVPIFIPGPTGGVFDGNAVYQ